MAESRITSFPPNSREATFAIHLKKVAAALLLLVAILNFFAASNSLVLFLDGAYYLLGFIEKDGFFLIEPTAVTVQVLQQFPLYLASWLGVTDLDFLTFLSGFSNLMLPLMLTVSCYWILPGTQKAYFVFPLVHYFAGTMASWTPTLTDAPPAAAYFWMLLYLILFHPMNKWSALLVFALSLPAMYLHEAMSFLSPVIVVASLIRFSKTSDVRYRAMFLALSIWFGFIAYTALAAILDPRDPENRSGFISGLLDFMWVNWDGLNIVVVISAIVFILAVVIIVNNLTDQRLSTIRFLSNASSVLVGASVFLITGYLLFGSGTYGFLTQFAARAQSVLISFPLSIFVLLSVVFPVIEKAWKDGRILVLVAWLGVGALTWHGIGTAIWKEYIEDFRFILDRNEGFIPFPNAVGTLLPGHRDHFTRLSYTWTLPTISILLSPEGNISTILGNREELTRAWEPFDPCNLEKLPKGPFDYTPYLRVIAMRGCSKVPTYKFRIFKEQFGADGIALSSGWYAPENWGVWSKGREASLAVKVKEATHGLELKLGITAFVPREAPNLNVDISVDGISIDTWAFGYGKEKVPHRVLIIDQELTAGKHEINVEFLVRDPRSPSSLGLGGDNREIGVALTGAEINWLEKR